MTDKIDGRTPDEIKKGLECCIMDECNSVRRSCPYRKDDDCTMAIIKDALTYIQQLERELDEARKEIRAVRAANTVLHDILNNVQRERDAAVKDIEDAAPCFACIHFERNGGDCIGARVCVDDVLQEALGGRYADYCFEWRGVQEVEV